MSAISPQEEEEGQSFDVYNRYIGLVNHKWFDLITSKNSRRRKKKFPPLFFRKLRERSPHTNNTHREKLRQSCWRLLCLNFNVFCAGGIVCIFLTCQPMARRRWGKKKYTWLYTKVNKGEPPLSLLMGGQQSGLLHHHPWHIKRRWWLLFLFFYVEKRRRRKKNDDWIHFGVCYVAIYKRPFFYFVTCSTVCVCCLGLVVATTEYIVDPLVLWGGIH